MKTRLYISILFCLLAMSTWAQTYKNTYTPKNTKQQEVGAIQSQQIMQTSVHAGTIYEPFSNTAPSEQSEVGTSYSAAKTPNRQKRFGNFDDVPEGGEQENSYPIGNPVLPLLLFAIAFGGVIASRRKRSAK